MEVERERGGGCLGIVNYQGTDLEPVVRPAGYLICGILLQSLHHETFTVPYKSSNTHNTNDTCTRELQ